MKLAVCLYGYFNNRADPKSGDKGISYLKQNVLDKIPSHDVDIYLHSWEPQREAELTDIYKPKWSKFEKQIDFDALAKSRGVDQSYIDEGFDRSSTMYHQCKISSSLSFFYSRAASLEFVDPKDYDCVIVCRYDIGHRSRLHKGFNVSQMRFPLGLDMQYIYSAMWKQHNAGYADQWFLGNPSLVKSLRHMPEAFLEALTSNHYEQSLRKWPDSSGKNQFSNERLTPTGASPKSYPRWQMINNHLFHKYFFLTYGDGELYCKSKFICHNGKVYG